MTANGLSADELAGALWRGASGMDTAEAAIRLLLAHGVWAARLAAAEFVELSDADEPEEPRYAWVGWCHAVAALDAGTLTGGSGSDNRVLRIAASPSELGAPVDLADAVTGPDRHNVALVLAALSHANGSHEHKDYAAERPADGSPSCRYRRHPDARAGARLRVAAMSAAGRQQHPAWAARICSHGLQRKPDTKQR